MPPLRPVAYKTLIKVFEQDGFVFNRQRGDHLIYTKLEVKRPIVIPTYHEVPVFIIKNLIRTAAGMTRDRYFELLDKC
ncbi:MAG: type II toxin-antitoxin system HicA family toxin [Terriglobia bacterium]